ncbi:MAG: hypothetical protein PHG85_02715 [Candidatus Altiarchaeota archaeon]|nr:hypothetical protein [Candidatus Altiarchaeota archaeon]
MDSINAPNPPKEKSPVKWQVNEQLLQSYRNMFLSSQSFMLAVGAIAMGKSNLLMALLTIIGLLMIWAVWFPIVRSRHLIVDYHKYQLNSTSPDAKICTETEYVHDMAKRKETNAILGIKHEFRPTRFKIDLCLPLLYSLIWILLLAFQLSRPPA